MTEKLSKNELLEAIKNSWDDLTEVIKELSEEQMTRPKVQDGWTVKDLMAHVAAWHRLAMDRLHAATTGEALKYPVIQSDQFVDAFNAETYAKFKDQPLNEVISEFNSSYEEFLSQIELLDEELLPQNLPFDWAGNLTYQIMISANTHWHYPEHIEAILKWLDKQDAD